MTIWKLFKTWDCRCLWGRRKTCGISLIYLAVRHFFINFTAEYATFNTTHCRT